MLKTDNEIAISLNPTYFCNFRCDFCYLTPEQLGDKKMISPEQLDARLTEIRSHGFKIGTTDLYGGEVTLLPKTYLDELHAVLMSHGAKDVELITNMSAYRPEIIEDPKYGVSVSYDFEYRPHSVHVRSNMHKLQRDFTILTLGIPQVLADKPVALVKQIHQFERCMNWEIKPYSQNQANQHKTTYSQFEELVKGIIQVEGKRFRFLNELAVDGSVKGVNNSFSDDHVYITPSGDFGVLDFDLNDNEFFKYLKTFDEYLDWTIEEKARVYSNQHCSTCEYLGGCLSEHLRDVKSIDNSCNGFVGLINWYRDWKR